MRMGWLLLVYGGAYLMATGLATLFGGYRLWVLGLPVLRVLLYFKLLTSGALAWLTYRRNYPERLFYRNLGYDPGWLLAGAVAVDWSVWLLVCRWVL